LAALENKHGPLPPTATSRTRRGHHRFFSIPDGVTVPHKGKKNGSSLEIISGGHYVLLPPSIHPSGIRYEWINDITEFVEAPDWLIQYAIKHASGTTQERDKHPPASRDRRIVEALANLCAPEAYSERGEARIRDALRFLSADADEDWFHRAAEI